MQSELQQWLTRDGVRFFKTLGLQPGDRVLDFGCGDGVYSIPASYVLGKNGVVYALDRDRFSLKRLAEKASSLRIRNIILLQDLDGLIEALEDRFLDAVLFFDVIHSYYFTAKQRTRLLTSISTMVKKKGLISVFPRHMEDDEISSMSDTLFQLGFILEKEQEANLMHDGYSTYALTMCFRKKEGASDAENKTL
jgi:cyclopropane fatty-acyl-phospholipid synthase-like methyltransferase